jgi:hypothetical protein
MVMENRENNEYFATASGFGVLATSNNTGRVNAALYAKPYFVSGKTVAFVMAERLTHENLKLNPHAAYVFVESGTEWSGRRLYLRKVREEVNEEMLNKICSQCDYSQYETGSRFVVYLEIEETRPLLG